MPKPLTAAAKSFHLCPTLCNPIDGSPPSWAVYRHFFLFVSIHRAAWAVCIFWILIPCQLYHFRILSSILFFFFILLMVSFAMKKLLSLIRSHLCIFVFISIMLGWLKKILLQFMWESILPMFSSESFIVSIWAYIKVFKIHFEFIFMYRLKNVLSVLHVAVQFSQYYLSKRFFSPLINLAPLL